MASFVYFRPFLDTVTNIVQQTINGKSVEGVLETTGWKAQTSPLSYGDFMSTILRLVGCFHKRLCVHFEASRLFLQTILHLRFKPNQLFLEYDFCDFEVSGLFPHTKQCMQFSCDQNKFVTVATIGLITISYYFCQTQLEFPWSILFDLPI